MAAELHTLHHSMRNHVIRRAPRGFDALRIDYGAHETLSRIALETFVTCINQGMPLQDALLAVYMTGLENGCEASKEARQ